MTDNKLRWIYGYIILSIIGALGLAIALGKVEEQTSYGLHELLLLLAFLGNQFGQWAYGNLKEKDK